MRPTLEARVVGGVGSIDPADWDRLVGPTGSPFAEHAFLAACEADSATPEHGVLARHVTVHDGERLVAALPLYVKGDGRGEFIYDYHWYHLAWRVGAEYYPKLVSMFPFTPAPGGHFLIDPAADRASLVDAVASVVLELATSIGMKGVHYLFLTEGEADHLEGLGQLRRLTYQLVLENDGFESFDDYVLRFRSKDRGKIRRERRRMVDEGIEIEAATGDQVTAADGERMFGFYSSTCGAHGTGSRYLTRPTWEALFASWTERIVIFRARREGRVIGGSLCVEKDGVLYGRYWGADHDVPDLYFNLAFYEPIALMIERGWRRFHVGSGNSRYKYSRGFAPYPTHSTHTVLDARLHRVLDEHLAEDRARTALEIESLRADSKMTRR